MSTVRAGFAALACVLALGACSVEIGSGDPVATPTTAMPPRSADTTPRDPAGDPVAPTTIAQPRSANTTPDSTEDERPLATGCHQEAPPGASSEARAYLAAANATYPLWIAVTRTLESQGGHVYRRDLAAQIEADLRFKALLDQIHFTGAAAAAATRLDQILGSYIATLIQLQGTTDPLQLETSAAPLLDERRAEASAQLRTALGLPPSTCDVWRP